jgi:SOS response regulatory protein OraA/RecX
MVFNEYVKIREEKFGSVIFETLREKVFVTNETGKDILNLLQKGYSTDQIANILSDSYNNENDQIRNDVISFINQLRDNGIIIEQRA